MKALVLAVTILCLLFITGCANKDIGQQYKFIEPNAKVNTDIGYLKIYTINYKEKGTAWDDPVSVVYKGYTIYTTRGDLVLDVKKAYVEPKLVRLKEGEYIVIAELHKNIVNSFPVKIEIGKLLEVDKSMIENPFASK